MKENYRLTREEWNIKRHFDVEFNKIFFSNEFRNYITEKFGYCPSGLTMDTIFFEDGEIVFNCCVKRYGYEYSTSNGIRGDLGDYVTDEISNEAYLDACMTFVNKNFKELKKEIVDGNYGVSY